MVKFASIVRFGLVIIENNVRFQKYSKGRHINTIQGEKKKRRSGLSTLKRKMVGKKNWRTTRATSRSTSRPRRWCWCPLYWSTTRSSSPCATSRSRRTWRGRPPPPCSRTWRPSTARDTVTTTRWSTGHHQ